MASYEMHSSGRIGVIPNNYLPDVDAGMRFRLEFGGRTSIDQAKSLRKILS